MEILQSKCISVSTPEPDRNLTIVMVYVTDIGVFDCETIVTHDEGRVRCANKVATIRVEREVTVEEANMIAEDSTKLVGKFFEKHLADEGVHVRMSKITTDLVEVIR